MTRERVSIMCVCVCVYIYIYMYIYVKEMLEKIERQNDVKIKTIRRKLDIKKR